ncbi:hypothetical protein [Thiorhodococcus minor]|uniref:O-antigen ligase family protein n=1 Tax=Thiorhodococcus minor TaxID=57489 RepID=A0A6M0K626_9GAMM|nr:hypothetical protein [Thiorhodococcus minor]NEV65238.1 hypothetical protein [Thiorhodococcus minor]
MNSAGLSLERSANKGNMPTSFLVGFWLLLLATVVNALEAYGMQFKTIYMSALLISVGTPLIVWPAARNLFARLSEFDALTRFAYLFFLIVCIITAVRPLAELDLTTYRDLFGIRYGAWAWLIPLTMLLPVGVGFIQPFLSMAIRHARFGIIAGVTSIALPFGIITDLKLTWGCGLLMLLWNYLPSKGRKIALISVLMTIGIATLNGTRTQAGGYFFLFVSSLYILAFQRHALRWRRVLAMLFGLPVVLGLTAVIWSNDTLKIADTALMERIEASKEGLLVDTRTRGTGETLWSDFYADLKFKDYLIGRGAMGKYRSAASGGIERLNIEWGYGQVLLKGGLFLLLPMLFLAGRAVWKGLLSSKNWMVRGFAFIVIGWLLEMSFFGLPATIPRYVLFWIAIGVCLRPSLCRLTDAQLAESFRAMKMHGIPPRPHV